jgi:probable HAF family extracellular repeat protein
MKTIHLFKICGFIQAAALSAGLGFGFPASADNTYSYIIDLSSKKVTELGSLGGDSTHATGINDSGRAVGDSHTAAGVSHAFITGPDGIGITDLGTLGGNNSYATAINAVGQVVGYSDTKEGLRHAFITGPDGVGMTDLDTQGGSFSGAYGINDAGQVVGYSSGHPFLTGPNGVGMTDLVTSNGLDPTLDGVAVGINGSGQVVGWLHYPMQHHGTSAFVTGQNGVGIVPLEVEGAFAGINTAGQVVGADALFPPGSGPAGIHHAFITGPNGMGVTDLGTLGGRESSASDISAAGQVIGWSDMPNGNQHAFITGPNGVGLTDLNSLVSVPDGIVLTEAIAINNMGQVVAISTTIPEPASYTLMLAGLGLLGFMARRGKAAS